LLGLQRGRNITETEVKLYLFLVSVVVVQLEVVMVDAGFKFGRALGGI
jgi:hypothetical protein